MSAFIDYSFEAVLGRIKNELIENSLIKVGCIDDADKLNTYVRKRVVKVTILHDDYKKTKRLHFDFEDGTDYSLDYESESIRLGWNKGMEEGYYYAPYFLVSLEWEYAFCLSDCVLDAFKHCYGADLKDLKM